MAEQCPICATPLNWVIPLPGGKDVVQFSCPRCGDFTLSGLALSVLPGKLLVNKDGAAKLSHAIHEMQRVAKGAEIYTNTLDRILETPLPRPREQADLLIRSIAETISGPGETIWVEYETHGPIIGAKSEAGFDLVLSPLFDVGLLTGTQANTMSSVGRAHVTLTFEGWDYYESLVAGAQIVRKAFIAMKFGDGGLDRIVNEHFRPAVKATGFELVRLDDKPQAGLIDDRLRVEIQSSAFVLADLTHDNLGAYWEAGYAEGLGKSVIYTCAKAKFDSSPTHFDTNHHLTILWDLSVPEEAAAQLKATIRATLPHLASQSDGNA